jgi:hypothetical protein
VEVKVQPPSTIELDFGVPIACQVRSLVCFIKRKKEKKESLKIKGNIETLKL